MVHIEMRVEVRIGDALALRGLMLVEVDMPVIGPIKVPFAGPGG